MSRMPRAELYLRTALLVSEQSTCLRGRCGALIVKDKRIVSHGYNGAPPGLPHCLDVGCEQVWGQVDSKLEDRRIKLEGCVRAIHAESNAIAFAARAGIETRGAHMYCTHAPCLACSQIIISCGIKAVYYLKDYRADALDLLDRAGITTKKWELLDA